MTEPRQRSIGLSPSEKARLDSAKRLYEERTGDRADFGKFLGIVTALGLGALGIYKLQHSSRKNPSGECPECGEKFSIAYSADLPPVVYVVCPNPECGTELVVDFTES